MTIRSSSSSGIPFGNNSSRPSSPSIGQPYFNGESQRLELYTGAQYGWQNIVAETPGVTGYTGTVLESNTTNTITVTGTNFAVGATATLIGTDGTEYTATSTTVNNLTSLVAVFDALSASKEPYDIRITNPSNLYGVYYDILTVNDSPVWFTAAGSLGTIITNQVVSIQLSATDEENTITYAVSSGSLPAGLSLSSSGLISGTASGTSSQTFNFTVTAADGANTVVSRSFNIIYTAIPILSGGTITSDSTYYYRTFSSNGTLSISNIPLSADVLLIGGGGGGGNDVGSGGGAGGLYFRTANSISTGSYPIVIGAGGTGLQTSTGSGVAAAQGISSTFNSLTADGGGSPGSWNNIVAGSGGSGGGGACRSNGVSPTGGSSTQSTTTPTYGFGNPGGNADHSQSVGFNDYAGAGGGGGAGGAGGNGYVSWSNGGNATYGAGGIGKYISEFSLSGMGDLDYPGWFAGGGGASSDSGGAWGYGGKGGGGDGNNRASASNTATGGTYYIHGKPNTGGGAGGGGSTWSSGVGGNGGSGVMIIRYTKASVGG